jgi:arabinogalactan oligomer/maltooligosaccharide transport system substrate-binding protein
MFAAGLAVALVLTACGSDDEGSSDVTTGATDSAAVTTAAVETTAALDTTVPVTDAGAENVLTVWTEDYYVSIFEPLVADWEAETGIDVQFTTKEFGTMTDEFIAAVPVGEGPDLFIAPTATNRFVSNGVVAPVELGDAAAGLVPVALNSVTLDGQIYGVPFTVENIALYRNVDLVTEAPATFDDLIAAGTALKDAGTVDDIIAIPFDAAGGNPYLMMPLQSSFGSTLFGTDPSGNPDGANLTIDDEQGLAFAKALGEWGATGVLNPDIDFSIALSAFQEGKIPFYLSGPWDLTAIKDSGVNFAIDPIPGAGGQPAAPFVGHYGVYQSSEAKNPVAASLFLSDFMMRVDTQVGIWETAQNPPALIAASEQVSSDPNMKAFAEVGAIAFAIPAIPAMDQVWGPWGETQMAIVRGQGDPAELWAAMGEKIRAAIAGG